MVFPLNPKLKTTIRSWLLDRPPLNESSSHDDSQPQTLPAMDTFTPVNVPLDIDDDADPHQQEQLPQLPQYYHHPELFHQPQQPQRPRFLSSVHAPRVNGTPTGFSFNRRTGSVTAIYTNTNQMAVEWPTNQIPVEIFELIASYLSRAEVKIMRLVCREFESKVSARYFKNVVVPFRSELYGTLSRDEFGARKHPSSTLLSNGMRIFESFGPHILRFALSLELNEEALAHPPLKPSQAAVPSFWGVYRWPHETYNRYSDLEGIEQTADETEGMKQALGCLEQVTNLGLCCDAGLGFLVHPDTVARGMKVQQPVFSTQNWRREQRSGSSGEEGDVLTIRDFNGRQAPRRRNSLGDPQEFKRVILEKMAMDAGFRDSEIDEAVGMILETERTDLTSIDFDERPGNYFRLERRESMAANGETTEVLAWRSFGTVDSDTERADVRRWPLIPSQLTRAQKELLLELEWAHRAMIQSYVIAVIDNASMGSLNCLTTLTIAKIPSSHIHIFYRDDFWDSFSNLANVSLGVIPDWRRITKPAPGCIEEEPVSPLEAVTKTYRLLQSFIGKQPHIESLHFEWICGGEFAPSSFQRNQYVLPAPFLEDAEHMALPAAATLGRQRLLNLPHVKHLSLKNCWIAPHVLTQVVRQMALSSLEKLEFETVSLSGQPTPVPQLPILHQNMMQLPAGLNPNANLIVQNGFLGPAHQAHVINMGLNPHNPPPPEFIVEDQPGQEGADIPTEPADRLRVPDWLTWAGFMEHFSPGINIRQAIEEDEYDIDTLENPRDTWARKLGLVSGYLPRSSRLISDERRYKLKCLSFKSCGYVHIESSHVNTRAILPPGAQGLIPPINNLLLPSRLMMRCKDKMLGQVIPYMRPQEIFNLTTTYELEMGWGTVYDAKIIEDAVSDGLDFPGLGRFSGLVDVDQNGTWTGYSSASDDLTDSSIMSLSD